MMFSNTGNVSLTVNMGALVTREQLTEAVKQHNTDISSHPAITAMIAKILGATNWQENPVATLKDIKNLIGQGAIVASKLDANAGFVKFANGFTIQWGLTWFDANKYYKDISLPISSTVLIALATDDSVSVETSGAQCFITWNSGFSQANRNTIRFLTTRADTGSFVWMAVGKA